MKLLQKLRIYLTSGLLLGILLVPATASAQLFEGGKNQACEALNLTNGETVAGQGREACGTTNNARINSVISTVLNILSLVVGVVAVVMVIIAGLKYITSQGDSASVSSAKNTLLYAVIGIIIVAMAQFIVQFVLARTDVDPNNNGGSSQQTDDNKSPEEGDELKPNTFDKPTTNDN